MRRARWWILGGLVSVVAGCGIFTPGLDPVRWEELPSLPESTLGFGGPFAGDCNGALVVAGGANFPVPLAQGGKKVWHDEIYLLSPGTDAWRVVGQLERPLAYGASASLPQGLLLVGGCDAEKCYDDVVLLTWKHDKEEKLERTRLPKLPKPCAFTCAALVGNMLYVAGGQGSPTATTAMKSFWSLDLRKALPKWQVLEPWPGAARVKAVAGALQGAFYLFSGCELVAGPDGKATSRYLTDAYRYRPETGWEKLPDLPRAVAAAPTPARQHDRRYLMIFGGATGTYGLKDTPAGFSHGVLGFDVQKNIWVAMGTMPFARVTTCTVLWSGMIVVPTGEVRPGIRSPTVYGARPRYEKTHAPRWAPEY